MRRIRSPLTQKRVLVHDVHHSFGLEAAFSATLKSWIINEDLTIKIQDEEDLEDIVIDITKRMNRPPYNWNGLYQDGEHKPQ